MSEPLSPSPDESTRRRARHVVYERMALISALIWIFGTAILFAIIVPYSARPFREIAMSMTIPLLPAALPWLFYGRISDVVARRWMATRG
jgi:hypothetical protein